MFPQVKTTSSSASSIEVSEEEDDDDEDEDEDEFVPLINKDIEAQNPSKNDTNSDPSSESEFEIDTEENNLATAKDKPESFETEIIKDEIDSKISNDSINVLSMVQWSESSKNYANKSSLENDEEEEDDEERRQENSAEDDLSKMDIDLESLDDGCNNLTNKSSDSSNSDLSPKIFRGKYKSRNIYTFIKKT